MNTSLEAPTARSSPATKLPLEIVEMIIAHLIYDTESLLACSLTCYSWYIASVPHLHHTLTTRPDSWPYEPRIGWPTPLRNASELGLLPLVKKFRVHASRSCDDRFSSKRFNRRTLSQFSALTNVQELRLDNLDIPSFMPRIRWYFCHFLPTVRSLVLGSPGGSRRQIIFFIGLFQHLEDLTLFNGALKFWESEPTDDPTLIPPFAPPLRGRLVVFHLKRVDLLKHMIHLFGGIRFRCMEIFDVEETRLLLDACAGTLKTLYLYPTDPCGEQLNLKRANVQPIICAAARPPLPDFDLSGNKSLRTLEVRARSIVSRYGSCTPSASISSFLRTVLSTITSLEFSEVVVIYRDTDFCGVAQHSRAPDIYRNMTPGQRAKEALRHRELFGVLREMYGLLDFRLVLCAEVWDCVGEYAMRVLKQAVAAEKAGRRLDYLPSEPSAIYSPRGSPNICVDRTN